MESKPKRTLDQKSTKPAPGAETVPTPSPRAWVKTKIATASQKRPLVKSRLFTCAPLIEPVQSS